MSNPGTLVFGGIVILVRDNLIKIDTGLQYKNLPHNQVLPRVPQHMGSLLEDELRGLMNSSTKRRKK